jgi:CheY-like chemotaxis protein
VDGDPTRLEQIFANLLNNSAKYTEPEGQVWVMLQRESETAVLRVRDTGIGIGPELLPHVFDMFVQAEHGHDRAKGGLGIGLCLVRNLVEMHGGTISAQSEGAGKGSEFTVRLPAIADPPGPQTTPPQHTALQPPPAATRRILVVDDNVDAADSLALLLRLEGHDVQVVHDGPAALQAVQVSRPELIFLDIGLPGMNGYEIARRIRQLPGGEDIVLFALTGWGQQDDRRQSREAGFDQHLVKPVHHSILEALLSGLSSSRK